MRSKEDELLISCCDKNLSGTFRELQNLVEEEGLSVSNSLRVIQNQINHVRQFLNAPVVSVAFLVWPLYLHWIRRDRNTPRLKRELEELTAYGGADERVSELTISLYLTNNTTEIRWIKSERQAFAWESQEWLPFITPQLSHRWTPRMTWTLLSIFLRLHWLSARRAVTCGSSYADFPFPSSTDSFPETQSAGWNRYRAFGRHS